MEEARREEERRVEDEEGESREKKRSGAWSDITRHAATRSNTYIDAHRADKVHWSGVTRATIGSLCSTMLRLVRSSIC